MNRILSPSAQSPIDKTPQLYRASDRVLPSQHLGVTGDGDPGNQNQKDMGDKCPWWEGQTGGSRGISVVTRVIYKEETFAANRNKRRKRRQVGGGALHGQKWLKIEINKSIGILQHMLCTCFFSHSSLTAHQLSLLSGWHGGVGLFRGDFVFSF